MYVCLHTSQREVVPQNTLEVSEVSEWSQLLHQEFLRFQSSDGLNHTYDTNYIRLTFWNYKQNISYENWAPLKQTMVKTQFTPGDSNVESKSQGFTNLRYWIKKWKTRNKKRKMGNGNVIEWILIVPYCCWSTKYCKFRAISSWKWWLEESAINPFTQFLVFFHHKKKIFSSINTCISHQWSHCTSFSKILKPHAGILCDVNNEDSKTFFPVRNHKLLEEGWPLVSGS